MSEYGLRDDEAIWVHRMTVDDETPVGSHLHATAQLAWVERGQLSVVVGDRQWVLAPTQAIWIPAGEAHDIRVLRGSSLVIAYLWEEECEVGWAGLTVLAVENLARELLRHLAREDLDDRAARHARATLLSVLTPTAAAGVELPVPDHPRAKTVAAAVLADPARAHTLEEWAGLLHTSEKTIQRAFLADTGMTFSEWRTQVRLFQALPLLADHVPVSAVAARIGYTSTNGFTSAFRRQFGTTPAAYFTA